MYALYTIRVCDVYAHYTILYYYRSRVRGRRECRPRLVVAATPSPPLDYARARYRSSAIFTRGARGGGGQLDRKNETLSIYTYDYHYRGVPVCVVMIINDD